MFDPFSVVEIVDKYESMMSKNDIAGIGKADITYILDSFFSIFNYSLHALPLLYHK